MKVPPAEFHLFPRSSGDWIISGDLFLQDRPGELEALSEIISSHGCNIEMFHYNRSKDPHRVLIAAKNLSAKTSGALADLLRENGFLDPIEEKRPNAPEITEIEGLLKIKANLEDRPGTLAAFAAVLKDHNANVIYMAYDGDLAPGMVEIAMATASPEEISLLLADLNDRGYHYYVEWQGTDTAHIDNIIGLSLIEQFLLKLKSVLPPEAHDDVKELINSSDELQQALLDFKQDAGENEESMAASETFGQILNLATSSIYKTGPHFSLRLTGPLHLTDDVSLYMLTCPTGANGYLLRSGIDFTLIDSSYGIYYADVKAWLAEHGLDPSRIKRSVFTHADADHAGWAFYLQEDFGTEIFMHPGSEEVFKHENRAFGSKTRLYALNGHYTRLINRFTRMRPPGSISRFLKATGTVGGFSRVGSFTVGDINFDVLESLGGHVPDQIFLFAQDEGILFSGDYLIDFKSLSDRTKSTLNLARYLMTSTNNDSRIFEKEMKQLALLILNNQNRLEKIGKTARVFPGHGEFYAVDEADWLKEVSGASLNK